jgi:hypothetical protein
MRRVIRPGGLTAEQVQELLGDYATSEDVVNAVAGLVNSAPETLDTLKELADAIDNDADFAQTVLDAISNKAEADHNHDGDYASKSSALVVVNHGSDDDVARPSGVGGVYWVGSVEPSNSVNGDLWYNSDSGELTPSYTPPPPTFITTWKTDNTGVTNSDQIRLPLVSSGSYDFVVDWGDGTTDAITAWDQTEKTHTYEDAGTYTVSIVGEIEGFRFNYSNDCLKILSVESWGPFAWGQTQDAFAGCGNMAMNATDAPDLSKGTTLRTAFTNASFGRDSGGAAGGTGTLANWDVSGITNMSYTFYNAMVTPAGIEDWDVSSVTTFEHFSYLDGPTLKPLDTTFNPDVSGWDVSSCTNFARMFQFQHGFNANLSQWDMSSATDISLMFFGSSTYGFGRNYMTFDGTGIDAWDVSNVIYMYGTFARNDVINVDLSGWDVSNVIEYGLFDDDTPNWTLPKPNFI